MVGATGARRATGGWTGFSGAEKGRLRGTQRLDAAVYARKSTELEVRNMVNVSVPERVAMKVTGHKTRAVSTATIVSPADLQGVARRLAARSRCDRHGRVCGLAGGRSPRPEHPMGTASRRPDDGGPSPARTAGIRLDRPGSFPCSGWKWRLGAA